MGPLLKRMCYNDDPMYFSVNETPRLPRTSILKILKTATMMLQSVILYIHRIQQSIITIDTID